MTRLLGSSPCRSHPCSREHAELVATFRELVRLWEAAAEVATGGYAAELAHYRESHPPPTFRWFLERIRRRD